MVRNRPRLVRAEFAPRLELSFASQASRPRAILDLEAVANRERQRYACYDGFVLRQICWLATRACMLHKKVGAPAQGSDFYDREVEQRKVWRQLASDHLLLLAPRRVGKTSLMLRLKDTAARNGHTAAFISVSDAGTEIGFLKKICAAVTELRSAQCLHEKVANGPLGKLFRRVKKVGPIELVEAPPEQWHDVAQSLTRALAELTGRCLLLVDELPVFVLSLLAQDATGRRARDFLNWFRTVRQGPHGTAQIRWLLAGSIGLDTVTARLRLGDTINDLLPITLGPFNRPTAEHFLAELGTTYEVNLGESAVNRILERTGWLIPYYLQLVFSELLCYRDEQDIPITAATVDQVFEDLVSPAKRALFDYWRQRLEVELGKPDAQFAVLLLNIAAKDKGGVSISLFRQALHSHVNDPDHREEKAQYLADILVGDGYLVLEAGRYLFRSPLLRDFWLRRVVQ
jgi:uncharacterized protein